MIFGAIFSLLVVAALFFILFESPSAQYCPYCLERGDIDKHITHSQAKILSGLLLCKRHGKQLSEISRKFEKSVTLAEDQIW